MTDPTQITRQIMGNVPGALAVVFYAAAFTACGLALALFTRKFLRHRRGRGASSPRRTSTLQRLGAAVSYLTFHRQLLRDRYAGVAHLLLFYGFFILFVGTCLVFLEHDTPLHFFYGWFYLVASAVIDAGGLMLIVGIGMFLWRRLSGRSARIFSRFDLAALLWLLLAIGVTGFALEAARIAVDRPGFERWSFVGYAGAVALNGLGVEGASAQKLHRVLWAAHAALCVGFFALLPWRFFSHLVFSAVSWAARPLRPVAALAPVTLSPDHAPGAATWRDLSPLDLLQSDACTTCGRCNAVCPAHAAGKPLRPREVVLGVRAAMERDAALTTLVPDEALWSCTTCGACNHVCPVGIGVYDKIVELRRGRVESGHVPERARDVLESVADRFNPFQKPNRERLAWATGLDAPVARDGETVELLYWVGCAGSFDPDGQSVARAMVKILRHLGVNYRVLGPRERCTGDPARRMGEEGLFQEQRDANRETFRGHGVRHVLTHCPHCFNAFAHEYGPVDFTVEHHSVFLSRMIAEGRLKVPRGAAGKVTFHDPCYLGRGNGTTHEPRQVLRSLPQLELVEMARHGRDSFCCGAGGGSLWLDQRGEQRIENQRLAEAARTGAAVVATGCPFCKTMLAGVGQASMRVADLAELVAEAEGL